MALLGEYRRGLEALLARLAARYGRGVDSPYADALTLQGRMLDNLRGAELYGDSEGHRAERAQILDSLNRLALGALDTSFNALCEPAPAGGPLSAGGQATVTASGERSLAVGGDATDNTVVTGNGNVVGNGNIIIQGAPPGGNPPGAAGLERALAMARRALAILEEQAAGYTALSTPVHLQIELEDQRAKVAALEAQLRGKRA